MATTVIDYQFDNPTSTSNPNGSLPTSLPADAQILAGPGSFAGRTLPKAVSLKTAPIRVDVSTIPIPDASRFHIRVIFSPDSLLTNTDGPQTLIESRRLPFSLQLKGEANQVTKLVCAVRSTAVEYRATETYIHQEAIQVNAWYTADIIYDVDTLGLLLNGRLCASHGFGPNGTLATNLAEKFIFIGGEAAPTRFKGRIALANLELGFNGQFENYIDQQRSTPQWYMSTAAESIRLAVDPGDPLAFAQFDKSSGCWLQKYTNGGIMYNPAGSSAFHIHGLIWDRYQSLPPATRESLGYLASNELPSSGAAGRKSLFQGGGIYWSPATPATEVVGQIYLAYEATAGSDSWGFPRAAAEILPGGQVQRMERAYIYFQNGAADAHEVHGDILQAYLAQGGPGRWGFPVSNELFVPGLTLPPPPGPGPIFTQQRNVRMSQFERASVYWSPTTGAHFVYGDIRERWLNQGGPTSPLGLPTTDEMDIPGGGRMSGFEHGVITWYGSKDSIQVVGPFRIFIGVLSTDESEGFTQGQNDLYFFSNVKRGNNVIYTQRFPDQNAWNGNNIKPFNQKIGPVITPDPLSSYSFTIDVWDEDGGFGGSNDHLGTWTKVLDASNSWGFRDRAGLMNSGRQSKVIDITAAVQPEVNIKTLSDAQKFFAVKNEGVDPIDYSTYAEAFRDVDSSPEIYDPLDWLDKAFYELVAKHLAKNGRCFGITNEAINAHIGSSIFGQPLDRFNNWASIGRLLAVKHQYQVGAASCWDFIANFLSGNWRDPKAIFDRTEFMFNTGNWPTLNISQGGDFTGHPHTIMPFAWDRSRKPAVIKVHDSNFSGPSQSGYIPGGIRELLVDFEANTWHYEGGNVYDGSKTAGGRLYFTPWSTISSVPRTPVAEAVVLLVAGTIVIMGDDTTTTSLTGKNGENLDAHGPDATAQLQTGKAADGRFVNHPIMAATASEPRGKFLLTRGHQSSVLPATGPLPANIVPALNPILPPAATDVQIPRHNSCWFKHSVRGTNPAGGVHQQLIKTGSTHIHLSGPIAPGETTTVNALDLNTTGAAVTWQLDRPKPIAQLTLMHRHGMSRDCVKVQFDLSTTKPGTVRVAHRPGLATMVLDPGTAGVTAAKMTLTVVKDAVSSTHSFDLAALGGANATLDQPVRLKLTPGSRDGKIAVSRMGAGDAVLRGQVTAVGTPVAVNVGVPQRDPPVIPH